MNWFRTILRKDFSVGLLVSVLLHAVIAAVLLYNWEFEQQDPQAEEVVSVEVVPLPEQEAPQAPEEEAPQEETAEEPPPPPPSQQSEEETAAAQPMEIFRPVFEFGDQESGPRQSLEGNSTSGDTESDEPGLADEQLEEITPAQSEDGAPAPPETPLTADTGDSTIEALIEAEITDESETEEKPETQPENNEELQQARTIFSQTDGEVASAMTAMANLPREVRGAQLCSTELREQLRHSSPPVRPLSLPNYRFPNANGMRVTDGAFLTVNGWYSVDFVCVINDEGLKLKASLSRWAT